jgi:predicted phage terminase large subunit-like protein
MDAIKPQPGPQEQFLSTPADIAIYGGAAGGGKSFALLLEPLRHMAKPGFSAVFFRRETPQITNPGGLWDETLKIYGELGLKPVSHIHEWLHRNGGRIKLAHLQHETDVYNWQGAQIPLICFDELTHFTKAQFFYMLSRNRTTCGVRPYIRATTNPDADSWVAEFISWWIDQETGLAIPERGGRLRWFIRVNDVFLWADTSDELIEQHRDLAIDPATGDFLGKSVAFIPAKLSDNQVLMRADPTYRASLMAQNAVERARLLDGNWKIRPAAGLYFNRHWCETVDAVPAGLSIVRYWDLAATEKIEGNDPDWTVGIKLGHSKSTGLFYLLDAIRLRGSPLTVETAIRNTASADGKSVVIGLPQDPGQAGKVQVADLIRKLAGYIVKAGPERGDKITRFSPFSSQAQAGNVKILRGPWNTAVFDSLEAFSEDVPHDDDADACAGAFAMFTMALRQTTSTFVPTMER